MSVADITIVPVDTDREEAYRAFSQRMAAVYRDHGATRVVDYWQVLDGVSDGDFHADGAMARHDAAALPDFVRLAGARPGETVVVSLTEWPDRATRDRGVAAASADPRVTATLDEDPVFDGGRLLAGCFRLVFAT